MFFVVSLIFIGPQFSVEDLKCGGGRIHCVIDKSRFLVLVVRPAHVVDGWL